MKYTVEEMIEATQRLNESDGKNDMGDHKGIQTAVTSTFRSQGLENSVISIYKHVGKATWEVHFDGTLSKSQREEVAKGAADILGIYPENLILFGLYPKVN